MTRSIDYFFTLMSPWAYLGHDPFHELAARHGLSINYKPVMLGQVFPETGGLPLAKRHPSRQRYRLFELQRWSARRGKRMVLKPKGVPFEQTLADSVVIALARAGHDPKAYLGLAHSAIWEKEENLADEAVLVRLVDAAGANGAAIVAAAAGPEVRAAYDANRDEAITRSVFGAPTYIVDGEPFWGQDRLDLLAEMLASGRKAYTVD